MAETQTQAATAETTTLTETSLLDQAISVTKQTEPDRVQELMSTLAKMKENATTRG